MEVAGGPSLVDRAMLDWVPMLCRQCRPVAMSQLVQMHSAGVFLALAMWPLAEMRCGCFPAPVPLRSANTRWQVLVRATSLSQLGDGLYRTTGGFPMLLSVPLCWRPIRWVHKTRRLALVQWAILVIKLA